MENAPSFACDLSVLDHDERARHQEIARSVISSFEAIRESPDGYSFRLPTDTTAIQEAATFISRERLCCPFFNFNLEVTAKNGPVWLHLSGGEGMKQYLEDNLLPRLDLPAE